MEKFLFVTQENHDAYFNLASEEYLLKVKGGYYIYLWRNAPAVIIGVNQNAVSEVNLGFTEEHGIKVVRRMTGGGAVYHDLFNINYTVIAPYDETADNYKKFTAPVIEYLNSLGVKAEFSGRNDITVDGKKISGNAQTIYDGRIMHHGTLLFHTDMSVLGDALKPNKLKTESKGIKSVRARVTNIYDCLPVKMSVEEFLKGLSDYFKKDCEEYVLTQEDIACIRKLADEKYSTYEWDIGRSPSGKNKAEARFPFGTLAVNFDTENGVIKNAEMTGDFFSFKPAAELAEKLNGVKFTKKDVSAALACAKDYIVGADGAEIAAAIFGENVSNG
ncbi:MAG: lipoate--protein ligase, partial [Candidatus Borkfalkiaceae bacterium]|nr:lipoate--protein ligase [Christensenellaceae bacterium]